MKLAKSPLIGERSGKRIGKTLNIVVKDVEEINMKKKHKMETKKTPELEKNYLYLLIQNQQELWVHIYHLGPSVWDVQGSRRGQQPVRPRAFRRSGRRREKGTYASRKGRQKETTSWTTLVCPVGVPRWRDAADCTAQATASQRKPPS